MGITCYFRIFFKMTEVGNFYGYRRVTFHNRRDEWFRYRFKGLP